MKLIIALIAILAAVLVTIWFRDGYVMGTAEDSLIFYNIPRFLPESQFAWMEHPGLGRVTLNLTAARPTYELLTFFHNLDIPNFLIQAVTIWLILVSAGVGIYLIVKEFFPRLPERYALLSVLFYWFNPLSLVDVWNRFLSDYIFAYGLLPIITFLFIRGLKSRNYLWSFILTLILPFYSFAFTYIAFDILLWIFFFLVTVLFFLTHKELNIRLFYIKFFFLTFLLFLFTNFWWISQLISLNIFRNLNSSVLNFDVSTNAGTLDALSKKMGNLSDIFRLVNASFLNENSLSWVKVFHSFPFIVMQFAIVTILFYSIIKNITNKSVLILAGLFFIVVYLAKGTNPPFGEIYQLIFTNVPYLQVFRNPFEKASLALSLTASLLIGFGVLNLISQAPRKFASLIYILFLGLLLLVWGFPFYTGLVFTSPDPPTNNYKIGYKVKVPQYYEQANSWLVSQGDNFRFIGFPLGDEGITYSWEKGYSGVELSSALFSTPGILHNTAVPYYHELVPHIQEILLSQNDFTKLANTLNVRFIFTRHDIDYEQRKMENPVTIDENLAEIEKNNEIKKIATFEKLTFWENSKWKDLTFYPANVLKTYGKQEVANLLNIDAVNREVMVDDAMDNNSKINKLNALPQLSYERINPTKYIIHVQNASYPFILVFSELYNVGWQALYEQGQNPKHYRVNYYANGWLIDKKGDYDLKVEFSLQRWLEIGEKISIISFLMVLCTLIFIIWKRKLRKE